MFRLVFDVDGAKRAAAIIVAALTLTACAGTNVVADKSRRFDQATAAYDAGDYASAYATWSQLAAENDLAAMRNAAHLLRKGLGVEKNLGRALDLYTEAARKGLILAMANVAEMHMSGEGTLKDPEEAARWYALAANGGLSIAMVRLADMHDQGVGVPKDADKARELRARASANGYPAAPGAAAPVPESAVPPSMTHASAQPAAPADPFRRRASTPVVDDLDRKTPAQKRGPVVQSPKQKPAEGTLPPLEASALNGLSEQDSQRLQAGWVAFQAGQTKDAFKLWRGLAEKGVAAAQVRLGGMFEHGLGINQDMIEAYRWYKMAALGNNIQAVAGAERVAGLMSPAEKAIAESMAASPQHWRSGDR